jgi:hypothetical protein
MLRTNRTLSADRMEALPKYCSINMLHRMVMGKAVDASDSTEGFWERASEVVRIDSGTYLPQEFIPDEIRTRVNADRGRPWPIVGRPTPVPDEHDDPLNDPALWQFREEMRVCGHCGEAFGASTHNQRFCSRRCRRHASSKMCVCKQCGREFRTSRRGQQYCSIACVGIAKRNAANSRQCGQCGRTFHAGKAEQRFCSRKCAWAWRRRNAATDL